MRLADPPVSPAPEALARAAIDTLLAAAGWVLQDRDGFNRQAAEGVAVREFPLPGGPCDYLLFVGGKACGVIEAKKAGVTLSGVAEQAARYLADLPGHVARWSDRLPFDYESTGDETYFRDMRDPRPRSRRVFAFHQPRTLHAWLKEPDTLRQRLRQLPPLDRAGLRDCQIDAATNQACAALLCGHLDAAVKGYLRLFFEKHYDELRGQAAGGVQPNLNLSIIKQTVLPLPPLAELHEICDRVASRLSEAEAVSAELGRRLPVVRALRQAVLKAAFSGQLVPQDPTDEPATALLARIAAQAGDEPATSRHPRHPAGRRRVSHPNPDAID